ncbi:MAG: hypothetical protein JO182_24295 [Acidobacteriaceae bacterium]|nr:hypothetical protein [Acidobacteriaceae bacterium]
MVRAVAHLLLAVFSLGLIAPAFNNGPESKLPACCQRNGKHHCAMSEAIHTDAHGPALNTYRQKCPFYPQATAPGSSYFSCVPAAYLAVSPNGQKALIVFRVEEFRTRFSTGTFQRGPPSLS